MPWQYSQSTGQLTRNGQIVGTGYSGLRTGRNNSSMESVRDIGPIPQGRYRIGSQYSHPQKGNTTMALTAVGHTARGRTHFLIHGDSSSHPGAASQGCIVLNHAVRQSIAASGDTELEVVR